MTGNTLEAKANNHPDTTPNVDLDTNPNADQEEEDIEMMEPQLEIRRDTLEADKGSFISKRS